MPRSVKKSPMRDMLTLFPSTMTLAMWRLRQNRWLLVVMGIGIAAAVMLVCAVPLYSDVAMTAGLRDAITSAPHGADVVVTSLAEKISADAIDANTQQLNGIVQSNLASYLIQPQFTIQTQPLPLLVRRTSRRGVSAITESGNGVQLTGYAIDQVSSRVKLLKGRLPLARSTDVEVALTQDNASQLHATVGSVVNVALDFIGQQGQTITQSVPLHIVGIFKLNHSNDLYFHGNDFSVQQVSHGFSGSSLVYNGLVSSQTIIAAFSRFSSDPTFQGGSFVASSYLFWYYTFDVSRITVDNLDGIQAGVSAVQAETSDSMDQAPYIEQTQTYLPSDIVTQYQARVGIAQTIVLSLLALVVGLVLFFVSMMADILVDSQAEAIAVLRSRGASSSQVVGALMAQSIVLGVLALIAGPLLAIVLVRYIVMRTLPAGDQEALNIISSNPLQVVESLGWYAVAAGGVVLVAMVLAFIRISRVDVLNARRESARSTRRPLWQRLNLDIMAIIVAITGYIVSSYVSSQGVLDAGQRLLLLSPLTLMKSVFLLIAAILLFLRFFLPLLRLGSWLAMRNRGAAPMLALAQMSRTPSQSVRMTLLLALAITFSIFTLVFSASQAQRILDVAAYQGGADFSGLLGTVYQGESEANIAKLRTQYNNVNGILSTSLGYTTSASAASNALYMDLEFRAVDASTFAQTIIWPDHNSSQSLSSMMRQLIEQRSTVLQQLKQASQAHARSNVTQIAVPAIVDALTWQKLHLKPGSPFVLNFLDGNVKFVAIAEVQHIPTVNDSTEASTSDYASPGGVIADFQSFSNVAQRVLQNTQGIYYNYFYAKSRDDATSVASVRKALTKGKLKLETLYDRRAVIDQLHEEPLYLTLIGVLTLEAVTALFLALIGALIASWLNVRKRLTSFALLRALGTAPRQVASVLTWEQGIVYTTAIGLGIAFGILLSLYVLPTMILTNIPPSGVSSTVGQVSAADFYIVQSVPPVRIVIPGTLGIALAALVLICIFVLGFMVRFVSRPSISQTLRLNED